MIIHADCRHYRSDRPCEPHKRAGRICEGCPEYDRASTKVLIVKLDATGDVLRTTSLLHPLHRSIPGAHVTWITRREAVDVLKPNRLIDLVVPLDAEALLLLQTHRFDVVFNPDASITSSRLAAMASASDKRGFIANGDGSVVALNDEAQLWYEMGLRDDLKRANERTYQSILLGMAALPPGDHPIVWEMSAEEARFAKSFAERHSISSGAALTIGLNTGAGGRWRWKKWTEEGFESLIHRILLQYPLAKILLYGGPDERDRNTLLSRLAPGTLVDTGTDNTLRQFGALVSLCDVMVTGDTMALHLASALGKRIVALFGPTSAPEIDLYGRGTKVVPIGMPCLGCYRSDCDIRPSCMQRIDTEQVLAALHAEFEAARADVI